MWPDLLSLRTRLPFRLILASLPAPLAAWLEPWTPGCFASDFPLCIYYWHPPFMDVLFAALVLAPFIATPRRWPLRLVGLTVLSIAVHALAVGTLVEFRGSIEVPGVDSIFINVVPVAVFASLAIALPGALIAGLRFGRRLVVGSILAGLITAAAFLATDTIEVVRSIIPGDWVIWSVWHVSITAALHAGATPDGSRISSFPVVKTLSGTPARR